MPRLAALLAAGAGSRFRGPGHKLTALLTDRPVWRHAFDAVLTAGFDHVVVVTGAVALPLPPDPRVIARHNPAWAEGQATSVAVAIDTARSLGAEAITIGLADQPFVTPQAWQAVADAPAECRIVVATYDGHVGPNPVRLAASVWPLVPTTGDEGARVVIREHAEWVCRVECLGSVADIDTLEDLERWRSC